MAKKSEAQDRYSSIIELNNFAGWEFVSALWQDLKLEFTHSNNSDKIAIVGDSKLQQVVMKIGELFTSAKVQFFPHGDMKMAQDWTMNKQYFFLT